MEIIKALREETGLSFAQIKKALDEASGDIEKARAVLRTYSEAQAEKKADREIVCGCISSYVHSNGTMGAMLILGCETDFVAKNDEFKSLAYDLAMHVTANGNDQIDTLLDEPFIKDSTLKVGERINSSIQKFGENIKIEKAVRFTI
jgi:elongation factor Ts